MAKETNTVDSIDFQVLWEGKPNGLFERLLTSINLNFTTYQITKDELVVQTGFFNRKTNTVELYQLKDPDLKESIYQRWLGIGTISVKIDASSEGLVPGRIVKLKNINKPAHVRKLLRDAIEADVMERKITYFDKI